MNRTYFLLWFALISIILLPTAAGRLLLDVAGGLIFILFAIPILLTGVGWVGWRFLQSKMIKCEFCGASIMNNTIQCPICGSSQSIQKQNQESTSTIKNSIPASSATIDITARDAGEEG